MSICSLLTLQINKFSEIRFARARDRQIQIHKFKMNQDDDQLNCYLVQLPRDEHEELIRVLYLRRAICFMHPLPDEDERCNICGNTYDAFVGIVIPEQPGKRWKSCKTCFGALLIRGTTLRVLFDSHVPLVREPEQEQKNVRLYETRSKTGKLPKRDPRVEWNI